VPDWDENSPQLHMNLTAILAAEVTAAGNREFPTRDIARRWQYLIMQGLSVPHASFAGAYRGEPGLENIAVKIGLNYGTPPGDVSAALSRFEVTLQTLVGELDRELPLGQDPDADQLAAILDLCAWAHSEWVRIHPFANGNGRTARLWANWLLLRYRLPPVIRLRPRPDGGYGDAGARAMQGDWKATVVVFRRLLADFLDGADTD
jgi:hypothetical protein